MDFSVYNYLTSWGIPWSIHNGVGVEVGYTLRYPWNEDVCRSRNLILFFFIKQTHNFFCNLLKHFKFPFRWHAWLTNLILLLKSANANLIPKNPTNFSIPKISGYVAAISPITMGKNIFANYTEINKYVQLVFKSLFKKLKK